MFEIGLFNQIKLFQKCKCFFADKFCHSLDYPIAVSDIPTNLFHTDMTLEVSFFVCNSMKSNNDTHFTSYTTYIFSQLYYQNDTSEGKSLMSTLPLLHKAKLL